MKIWTFDVDEFVEINELKPVTSPVLFERGGVPHPQGLVSNQIFGINTKDRKTTFAYIDLHKHFFHPHMLKAFRRMFRNVDKIIAGTENYSITKTGQLIKDENGNTGLEWLYENWEKVKWEKTEGIRNQRIDLLTKTPKNQVFMSKQIVIPAFYRDITSTTKGGGETIPINDMYSKLIRMASLIEDESLFEFSFNNTIMNIQNMIIQIYDYFKGKVEKKNGLIRRYLMGKSVDYSARSVITAPVFHCERIEDNITSYEYTAVPMAQCCVLFYPFIQHWVRNFFDQAIIAQKNASTFVSDDGDRVIEFVNPETYYTDKYIEKMIKRFVSSPETRFNIIQAPTTEGMKNLCIMGYAYDENNPSNDSTVIHRSMTVTDLLYIACCDVVKDKHVDITRFPVLGIHAQFFTKINVSSTLKTEPAVINGVLYKWYPCVELDIKSADIIVTKFNDTLKFSNSYLPGICGDYDGDQVTIKSVWSIEANAEAEKIIRTNSNFVDGGGAWTRGCNNEAVQTMYTLTRNP